MENLLVSMIFALCIKAGDSEKQIECHETYLNCIITGKSAGEWTEKDLDRCTTQK